MIKSVGVLGGGSWGTALANLLSEKGIPTIQWVRNEEQAEVIKETRENKRYLPEVELHKDLKITSDISEASKDKDMLVLAVPTQAVRPVVEQIKDIVSENQIIVNVAKGIENDTLYRISEIVGSIMPEARYAILSGPSHAEEVARKLPTTVVVASDYEEVTEMVQESFITPYFRVYANDDMVGVELGGSLKNVIALGAGISDGLGYGDNTKAALMNRGIVEIARLGVKLGAKYETFAGLSGIGDLIVTCTSMHSRNRRAGINIGKGMTMQEAIDSVGMVVEGIKTAKSSYELSLKHNVEMPIIEEIYKVLYENKDVKNSVINLMMRDKKSEM